MSGTINGGRKAAATNKARDPEFFKRIGAIGGRNGSGPGMGGFGSNRELARLAGAKGGRKSRRPKADKN